MEIESGEGDSPRISGLQRPLACDTCRARKCDKGSPCSNCRTANTPCRTTSGKRKEPKQRVLISTSYEKKIDRIEERLAGIEGILRRSLNSDSYGAASYPASTPSQLSRRPSPSVTSLSLGKSECDRQDADTFEGDTSLTAHSKYASELLERAVEKTQIGGRNPEMAAALVSLRNIVNRQNFQTAIHGLRLSSHHELQKSPPELPLPPAQVVRSILRQLKVEGSYSLPTFFPFLRLEKLSQYCQSVFIGTEDYPLSVAIIVHGCLHYLFIEASQTTNDQSLAKEYDRYGVLCKENFEICLCRLDLLMPATFESVAALNIAATYAVELSRPSLCGLLTTTAVALCQTLGYHRASSSKMDSREIQIDKMYLFWVLYTMDKSLSIRLGRASTIQDYDISVPLPTVPIVDDLKYQLWTELHKIWIHGGKIQGMIYEQLYSPGAMRKSASERAASANQLVEEMDIIRAKQLQLDCNKMETHHGRLLSSILKGDAVCYWSMLTLIYRAMPPPPNAPASTLHPECVEAARKALEVHQECSQMFRDDMQNDRYFMWGSYLHWFIIHLPFTPFIVTFCNIISTPSLATRESDLSRLTAFLQTLAPSPTNPHTSEAAEKLYHLCLVFHRVAVLYVEASSRAGVDTGMSGMMQEQQQQQKQQQEEERPASFGSFGELGPYLNALGFAGNMDMGDGGMGMEQQQLGGEFVVAGDGAASLEDWFSGAQHVMGLLEEDLSFIRTL